MGYEYKVSRFGNGPQSDVGKELERIIVADIGMNEFNVLYNGYIAYCDAIRKRNDKIYWLADYCKDFYPHYYAAWAARYRIQNQQIPTPRVR
jgi:hypothetical protein